MSASEDEIVTELLEQMEEFTLKRRAVDEAPFGITIADIRKEDQPLIYANEGFEEITGYSEDEILGCNCRFLQGENTDSEPVRELREAIEANDSVQVELRNYRKDGEQFWCEVTLAPIENDRGTVTHYVGFQQDVSKRKVYEKRLEEQRDDLTILNEMVRHDIRNDLQVALASMELLQVQCNETENEQVETAIGSIHKAIGLTNTARDVADVMLDTGADYAPIDIAGVLEAEIQEFQSSYPDATISVAGALPQVRVRANELLNSVFRNLLVNAIRHNDAENPEIRVSSAVEDGEVVVTVSDNGSGIPADAREHLFEKGWKRADSGGTGIGLYIVKRLVDNYGGEISLLDGEVPTGTDVSQEVNLGGATFLVRLPLAD